MIAHGMTIKIRKLKNGNPRIFMRAVQIAWERRHLACLG
jgi:hypothetical protein